MVFVNSMSDFFDEKVNCLWQYNALREMEKRRDLIWIILTKRSKNMRSCFRGPYNIYLSSNIWLGVTVENSDYRDRIKDLLRLQDWGGKRFISVEPMLEAIDIFEYLPLMDWVIIGGESGHNRRTIDFKHAQNLIDQCRAANKPVFLKQWDFGKGLEKAPFVNRENYMEYPK